MTCRHGNEEDCCRKNKPRSIYLNDVYPRGSWVTLVMYFPVVPSPHDSYSIRLTQLQPIRSEQNDVNRTASEITQISLLSPASLLPIYNILFKLCRKVNVQKAFSISIETRNDKKEPWVSFSGQQDASNQQSYNQQSEWISSFKAANEAKDIYTKFSLD